MASFNKARKGKKRWVVKRDGKVLKRFDKESDAFAYLHKIQPFSVHHATKYEGYKLEKIK